MFGQFQFRFAIATIALAATTLVQAQTVIYDNSVNFAGAAYPNGGTELQAGNQITRLVADQILTTQTGAPFTITSFSFSVSNLNNTIVGARPRVRFYLTDGVGGAPGTLITGYSFNPIQFAANGVNVFSATVSGFTVNTTNGSFWAGLTFDDSTGATGATLAQMNNLGQGIYGPPVVGSSPDSFFSTTAAGSFLVNNPVGTTSNFGGAPIANFGWKFSIASPVPEPGALLMFMVGLPLLTAAALRRRRVIA
jgi:hypothetical protein